MQVLHSAELSIFFKSSSTSLFTGGTFDKYWNNFHEYLIQHSLKSADTKDHFRRVKVPTTAPLLKGLIGYINFIKHFFHITVEFFVQYDT